MEVLLLHHGGDFFSFMMFTGSHLFLLFLYWYFFPWLVLLVVVIIVLITVDLHVHVGNFFMFITMISFCCRSPRSHHRSFIFLSLWMSFLRVGRLRLRRMLVLRFWPSVLGRLPVVMVTFSSWWIVIVVVRVNVRDFLEEVVHVPFCYVLLVHLRDLGLRDGSLSSLRPGGR